MWANTTLVKFLLFLSFLIRKTNSYQSFPKEELLGGIIKWMSNPAPKGKPAPPIDKLYFYEQCYDSWFDEWYDCAPKCQDKNWNLYECGIPVVEKGVETNLLAEKSQTPLYIPNIDILRNVSK